MKGNSSKTKHRSKQGGFTLVELIVVIAVLAILAGVGAVAYNGYITYAQKGKDRALVGEIMNAVELADYADPTLFGENGGAMIVLTEKGIKAAGGTDSEKLKSALEDAFGSLETATLSYGKWESNTNIGIFNSLNTASGSALANYQEMVKTGVYASFTEDMDDYWESLGTLVNDINSGNTTGVSIDLGAYQNKLIDTVVNAYSTENIGETTVNQWKEKSGFTNFNHLGGLDLAMARNYSFVSYAKKHVSGDMLTTLNSYNPQTTEDFFNNSAFKDSEDWNKIITDYFNDSAEADAKAYLALMDAAATYKSSTSSGATLNDRDFIYGLSGYVGMVRNVLNGATQISDIQELAEDVEGNSVVINAKKVNGRWSWGDKDCVSPRDANPRDGGEEELVMYTPKITLDNELNLSSTTVELSVSSSGTCTLTHQNGTTSFSSLKITGTPVNTGVATFDASTGIITAVGPGTTTLTLSRTHRDGVTTYTATLTIIVHP